MKRHKMTIREWLEEALVGPQPPLRWLGLVLLVSAGMGGCGSLPPVQLPDAVLATPHSGGSALAFDPTSQVVASGGWEGKIWIWRISGGERSHGWKAHDGNVNGIGFRLGNI